MKVKKIFFDTKFTELSRKANLISIGLISDCGDFSFYAEIRPFTDLKKSKAILTVALMNNLKLGLFAADNVIPMLALPETTEIENPHFKAVASSQSELSEMLKQWLNRNFEKNSIEFWGDVCAYDSVLLNELISEKDDYYGLMFPDCVFSYIPFDLATLFKVAKIDANISREEFARGYRSKNKHNALWRCETIKRCYEKLSVFLKL